MRLKFSSEVYPRWDRGANPARIVGATVHMYLDWLDGESAKVFTWESPPFEEGMGYGDLYAMQVLGTQAFAARLREVLMGEEVSKT